MVFHLFLDEEKIMLKILSALMMGLMLIGCSNDALTSDYLLTHPKKLQREFAHCDAANNYSGDCEMIRKAADDFSAMVRERSDNQEKFGERILLSQQDLKKMSVEIAELKKKSLAEPQNKSIQDQLAKIENEYAVKKQQVAVWLAVVSATSFE